MEGYYTNQILSSMIRMLDFLGDKVFLEGTPEKEYFVRYMQSIKDVANYNAPINDVVKKEIK